MGARRRPAAATLESALQADELTDAVIDVHDQIADLQIAKVGEKGLREIAPLLGRVTFFLEDVRLGVDLQGRVRQPEAARQRTDGDEHRRARTRPPRVRRGTATISYSCRISIVRSARPWLPATNRGSRPLARALPDVGDPVVDPAVELHGRLTSDMPDGIRIRDPDPSVRRRRAPRGAMRRRRARSRSSHATKACAWRQRSDVPRAAASSKLDPS